ncbi:MAG: AsmA family protein [Elusimicrobia bacterium]|nr:AsmA family protein [Elusimicrobiota bacterium]
MKSFKKFFIIFIATSSLLLLGLSLALKIKYPPEKIKKIALEELSKKLGREVSFKDVSINLFTGISLSEFKCSEKPNFQKGSFVECEKFSMGVNLLSLLQKEMVITSLKLNQPKIKISREPDGKTYNFSDLLTAEGEEAKEKVEKGGKGLKISVTKIKITKGFFQFLDLSPRKIEATLSLINLTIQGASFAQPLKINFDTEFSAKISGKFPDLNGKIEFSGVLHALSQKIKADHFVIKIPGFYELNLTGNIENLSQPNIDTSLEISSLSYAELIKIIPLEKFPKFLQSLEIKGTPKIKLQTKGKFDLEQFQKNNKRVGNIHFSILADFKETEIQFSPTIKKDKGIPLELDLAGEWNSKELETIEYSKANLKYKESLIETSGKIVNPISNDPVFSLNLKGTNLLLDEITNALQPKLPKGLEIKDSLNFDASINGNPNQLDLTFKADATKTKVILPNFFNKESGSSLELHFNGQIKNKENVEFSNLELRALQAEVKANGKILKINSGAPSLDLNIKTSLVQLEELLKQFDSSKIGSFTGNAFSDFSLKGAKSKLEIDGEVNLNETAILLGAEPARIFIKNKGTPFNLKIKSLISFASPQVSLASAFFDTESLQIQMGKSAISAKISLKESDHKGKIFKAEIHSPDIAMQELSLFLPSLTNLNLTGRIQPNFSVSGELPFKSFPRITGNINLDELSGNFKNIAFEKINGNLIFSGNSYECPNLSGRVANHPFKLKTSLKNISSPEINLEIEMEKLDLSSLTTKNSSQGETQSAQTIELKSDSSEKSSASNQFPESKFMGRIKIKEALHKNFESGNISFDWNCTGVTPALNKISGAAKLRTFGGEVKNIGAVEKILKIIDPNLNLLQFNDIGGDFNFKDGVMHIQDFWVESDKLNIGTEGTIFLPEKKCDIQILAHYSGAALAASIPISISGMLSNPKVEKKSLSILSTTLQEKILRIRPKTKEEMLEQKEFKEQKLLEKIEEKKAKDEEKKEKAEEKKIQSQERGAEKQELKKQREQETIEKLELKKNDRLEKDQEKRELQKQKELDRQEKLKEEEELKKQKEEERLERLKEKEEERLEKLREKEEKKKQAQEKDDE